MKVAVFGATGMVGSAIVAEGRSRGHEVITVSSRNGAADRVADVTQPGQVRGIAQDVDVVVISVPPPRTGGSHEPWLQAHQDLAGSPFPARLFLVGGAGSSLVDGRPLLESPEFPDVAVPESRSMTTALTIFRDAVDGVDWTILSPAPEIAPGERTGAVTLGIDDVVGSSVSTQDYAVAVWDELEEPKHRRTRFTVAT